MSYRRRVTSIALILSIFFLSSSQRTSSHYKDSTSIVLDDYQKSDSLKQWILEQKGICQSYMNEGKFSDVIDLVDEIEKGVWRDLVNNEELEAWGSTLVRRASAKEQTGDFIGAKKDYLEVLDIYRTIDKVSYGVVKFVYYPLANIYTRLRENEQATRYLKVYIDSSKANNMITSVGMGYSDLGTAYRNNGEFEKALEIYSQGIEEAKGSDKATGLLLSCMSEACLGLNRYEEGIEYGIRSLRHLNRIEHYDYIIGANLTLGKIYTDLGKYDDARSRFSEAEKALLKTYPNEGHRKWGKMYQEIGDLFVVQGSYEEGLKSYQRAFASIIPEFDSSKVENVPSSTQLYSEVVISEVLIKKAETFQKLADSNNDLKEHYLTQAIKQYQCYFEMEGVHRSEFIDESSKLTLVEEVHEQGEKAISAALELYRMTTDKAWLEECILFSEKTKGILLSESNSVNIDGSQGDFTILIDELQELESKINSLKSLIRIEKFKGTEECEIHGLYEREAETGERVAQLKKKIETEYPVLHRKILESNLMYREDIRTVQKKQSGYILTYYFGLEHIYCFGLGNNAIEFKQLEVNDERTLNFDELLAQLTNPNNSKCEKYSQLASKVYRDLFDPFIEYFTSDDVVIIPDGILTRLPFEALCSKEGKNFGDLDYLVKEYSVHYAYSLKWLNQDFPEGTYRSNFLGIAPKFEGPNKYSPLSSSEDEVKTGRQLGGETLLGNKATKVNFLENAGAFNILHLSTHAQMWDEEFQQASIAFYGKKNNEKNHLLASELPVAKIAPELMVLSACETGKGNYIRGEGMLSLSRIFARCGTKNIIASLWKVNHVSNSELLINFYDALRSDHEMSISNALTFSKRKYLKKNKYKAIGSHPYYWSGMVHMGNDDLNLHTEDPGISYYWYLLLAFPVSFLFYKLYKNRVNV